MDKDARDEIFLHLLWANITSISIGYKAVPHAWPNNLVNVRIVRDILLQMSLLESRRQKTKGIASMILYVAV